MPKVPSTQMIFVRMTLALFVYGLVFFGSAGTFNWPEGWLFILVYFLWGIPIVIWLKKNDPALLMDRMTYMKKSTKKWDKMFIILTTPVFLALFILPGLDAVRFEWSYIPFVGKLIGFLGIIASFFLITVVMKENTFLSRVVEVQKERKHKVIDTGPYAKF
jgi:protein-S-isoprenylcysteine O-methyltransferase Ste14